MDGLFVRISQTAPEAMNSSRRGVCAPRFRKSLACIWEPSLVQSRPGPCQTIAKDLCDGIFSFRSPPRGRAREIREIDIVLAYTLVPTGESAFHCFPPPTAEVTLRLTGVRMITKKKPSLYAIRGL